MSGISYDYDKKCLNYYLSQIKQKIYENQKILKLLFYSDSSPYDCSDVTEENAQKIIIDNPFPPDDSDKKESCQMNIFINCGRPINGDIKNVLAESSVCFRILCHKNLYNCDYGIRALEVLRELQETFNNKEIGIYKMKYQMFQEVRQGDNYGGFDVIFKVLEFNSAGKDS